jgi:hypothetical protein
MSVEYRVCWNASSHASFRGATDWQEWDDDDATTEDVELDLEHGGRIPDGLELALDGCGFEWWVETRVVQETTP